MKGPLLPLTAIVLVLLISGASALSSGDTSSENFILIEPEEMGVEVILNDPVISFDLSVLDPLIEEGTVATLYYELPDPEEAETFSNMGPTTFIMRSKYNPDLGVIVRKEMVPVSLDAKNNVTYGDGLSISIMIPGIPVGTERNMTSFFMNFDYTGPRVETLEERITDLEFTDIWHYSDGLLESVQFRDGTTEIKIDMMNYSDTPGRTAHISIDVKTLNGSLTEDLESRVLSVLDLFGGFPDFWKRSNRYDFKEMHYLIQTDAELDPNLIDWETTMRTQLLHFTELGLITGLSQEDIETISSRCEMGAYGPERRIVFDQVSEDWRYNRDTSLPPALGESFGPPETVGPGDLPPLTVPRTDEPETVVSALLIVLIVIGVILLLLGSVLYQRIDRAVKLNNTRRKMIYERIRQNPGIHFSALMKDLDLKPGVASYHINKLEKDEYIKSYQDGMYRRFYLYEEKVEMRMMLSDLQKIIVHTIQEEPGISQIDISKLVGKSKVVINYHVRFLRDLGLIILERDGRETHCFLTPQGSRMSKA